MHGHEALLGAMPGDERRVKRHRARDEAAGVHRGTKRDAGVQSAPRLAKWVRTPEPAREQRSPKQCFAEATAAARRCRARLEGTWCSNGHRERQAGRSAMLEITRAATLQPEAVGAYGARGTLTEAHEDRSHKRGLTWKVTGAPR